MTDLKNYIPWKEAGWFDQASLWIHRELESRDIRVSGPIEQPHIRPWSTVLQIPTTQGTFFFKASAPTLAHEPGVTRALYRWQPDRIQTVLAVDLERAWMLMPDESPWLRGIIQTPTDLNHWETILPLFADLQKRMIARRGDLLELGMLDRRLAGLPAQLAEMLADRRSMLIDQPEGLTSEQYRQLVSFLPRFADQCSQLDAFGIPETLHHDDFHDGNIFVPSGRYAFSDWAESCITHPFFTLLVALRSIAYRFDLAYGAGEHNYVFSPEIIHLRDIYLSTWEDYGSLTDLQAIFPLAWRVAMVNRALTWYRVVSHLEGEDWTNNASAVPAWLQEFLDGLEP